MTAKLKFRLRNNIWVMSKYNSDGLFLCAHKLEGTLHIT